MSAQLQILIRYNLDIRGFLCSDKTVTDIEITNIGIHTQSKTLA